MKIALYARVSTSRQADNDLSIPDQIRQLENWSKTTGHSIVQTFIEPGASATDDKRPVFQEMISQALQKPNHFDAIVIHSFSRFFRDGIEFGVYERRLSKNNVKVISITQPTSEDSAGEMVRRIITTFDEYNSKENSKHTKRAMQENARQGFFNGSRAPFGYQSVSTDTIGSQGRQKKKLQILDTEADVVNLIYELYLNGFEGKQFGVKQIAEHLNQLGLSMRGALWRRQKVQSVLADTLYMGEYYFNVIDSKTREKRPPTEWIKTNIPPIINPIIFEKVKIKRESRLPANSNPREISSPCLLTGLLKCGRCGGSLTLATGKGGKYRYYKCTNRRDKGNTACNSKNLPMDKIDQKILTELANKAFTPTRIQLMMVEYIKFQCSKDSDNNQLEIMIKKELKQIEQRKNNLLDAIESGNLEIDETIHNRMQKLKISQNSLNTQLAQLSIKPSVKEISIGSTEINNISNKLKMKLLCDDKQVARNFLRLLVDRITVTNNQAIAKGQFSSILKVKNLIEEIDGHTNQVPISVIEWGG